MKVGEVSLSSGRLVPFTSVFVENEVGQLVGCDAKIDTGFTGWLGLPDIYIDILGLEAIDTDMVRTADNELRSVKVYTANIVWGVSSYSVRVHEVGTMPLIGMSLLQGFVMTMDTRPGGAVLIETATDPIS